MPTIPQVLQTAVRMQNSGQLHEASQLYERVLKACPDQPDALHLLGLIANSRKEHEKAIALIEKAIKVNPESAVFHGNLAVALRLAGRLDDAITSYQKSLHLDPTAADTHFNFGKALKLKGKLAEAKLSFEKATQLSPHKVPPWLSLMNLAAESGNLDDALCIGEAALRHCPDSHELQLNLGVLLKRLSRIPEAIDRLRKSLALAPDYVEAMCKLATTLVAQHHLDEARELLSRANSIAPEDANVLIGFGVLHNTTGNHALAKAAYEKATRLFPQNASAHTNLGIVYKSLGELTKALHFIDIGNDLGSDKAKTLVNRGATLMALGRLTESQEAFRQAINLQKSNLDAIDSLLMCLQYDPSITASELRDLHLKWGNHYSNGDDQYPALPISMPSNPLRVGFVSADLGNHPVGYFSVKLFENLDPNEIRPFIYSDRIGNDEISQRIQKTQACWRDTAELDDEALADQIREDRIEILFDLAGHTAHNRLSMFAKRPAPTQVSWAGYVGTTGLACLDFLLADPYHVPPEPEFESLHIENVLRMPDDYICYEPPARAPDVSECPASTSGFVQFACVANPSKVNPSVLEAWAEILSRTPSSRLLFCYCGWTDEANQNRVLDGMNNEELASRVDFKYHRSHDDLLMEYLKIDIALDTFPYSGGLTTCEALWMGVPTITLPGERFASRHSLSHLTNAGYDEFVAESIGDYIELATNLASDIDKLSELRRNMREQVSRSPLCNGKLFAQNFSSLMQQVANRKRMQVSK